MILYFIFIWIKIKIIQDPVKNDWKIKMGIFTDDEWLMNEKIYEMMDGMWGWCCMLADDEYIHENYDI